MIKRKILLCIMAVCWVLYASGSKAQIKALLYHAHQNFGFSAESFSAQMDFLKNNGYHTITLQQFLRWHNNAEPLPPRPILITFDDNYIPVYDVAYPILRERGFCAVNFAHTYYVGVITGNGDHCDWNEIQEMEDAGVFYTESHTRTHPSLPTLSDSDAWDEIYGSKIDIETNMTSKTCIAIAYPYGNYDEHIITFCENAGYLMGFTTINDYNYRTTPLFELRRTGVGDDSIEQFKQKIGFYDLPPAPPGDGWTIDNTDPNFFIDSGEWTVSTSVSGYYGRDYLISPAGDGSSRVRWATYLPEDGWYKVYAWWTEHSNRATNAKYEIHHLEDTTLIEVDQRSNGGQWNLLGTFRFSATQPASIVLSNDADGYVVADGIWFEPTKITRVSAWAFF